MKERRERSDVESQRRQETGWQKIADWSRAPNLGLSLTRARSRKRSSVPGIHLTMASPPLGFLESVRLSWPVNVLLGHWVACMLVMIATCLTRSVYKRFRIQHKENEAESKTPSSQPTPPLGLSSQFWHRLKPSEAISVSPLVPQPSDKTVMRYQRTPRRVKAKKKSIPTAEPPRSPAIVQPFEAFLVLDIEGTCNQGTDFNYPNEIIVSAVFQPTSTPDTVIFILGTPSLLVAME